MQRVEDICTYIMTESSGGEAVMCRRGRGWGGAGGETLGARAEGHFERQGLNVCGSFPLKRTMMQIEHH